MDGLPRRVTGAAGLGGNGPRGDGQGTRRRHAPVYRSARRG